MLTRAQSRLSVVVVIGKQKHRAARCIHAILDQTEAPVMEILVVDVKPDGCPAEWRNEPGIRYLPLPGAESLAAAKSHGVCNAGGSIIALLEDHCVPSPGWATAVWRSFDEHPDVAAVAYAFNNLNPVNWLSRAFLVLAYGPWMAPVESGYITTPSWMNLAYRAEVLQPHRQQLSLLFECEMLFLLDLQRAGFKFWQAGEAHVFHLNHPALIGSCGDSAVWQRLFAAARVRKEGWGWGQRLLYAVGSPLSPLVIIGRLGRRLWGRPLMRSKFLKAVPLMLVAYGAGIPNEMRGYLFGRGEAGRKSIEVETSDPRGEAF